MHVKVILYFTVVEIPDMLSILYSTRTKITWTERTPELSQVHLFRTPVLDNVLLLSWQKLAYIILLYCDDWFVYISCNLFNITKLLQDKLEKLGITNFIDWTCLIVGVTLRMIRGAEENGFRIPKHLPKLLVTKTFHFLVLKSSTEH